MDESCSPEFTTSSQNMESDKVMLTVTTLAQRTLMKPSEKMKRLLFITTAHFAMSTLGLIKKHAVKTSIVYET